MIFVTGGKAQGKRNYVNKIFGISDRCIFDYQERIRDLMREGTDPETFTADFLDTHPDIILVMDEVGSGIIPLEEKERRWRDACGRCGCMIAERADAVVRLVCGIPMVIKGELHAD